MKPACKNYIQVHEFAESALANYEVIDVVNNEAGSIRP